MKMSEAKFVPGPWRVRINNGNILVVGPNNIHIGTSECKDRFPTNKGTQAANARLMAAAPEMYQALKTLLFNCRHGNGLEAQYQALDKAESALAKAEGRS